MSQILVVDCETTSLDDLETGSLIQVGVCEKNTETGVIKPVYEAYVKDGVAIKPDAWIFKNTPLTPQLIEEKGIPITAVRETLNELFKDKPVTAFNKQFDFKWLRSRGVNIPIEAPCIMITARNVMKSRKYAVPVALDFFKIEAVEPHSALDDAILEAVILRCLDNKFPETQNKLDWNVHYDTTRLQPKSAPKAEPILGISEPEAKKHRYAGKVMFFDRLFYAMDHFSFDLSNLPIDVKMIYLDAIEESKKHMKEFIQPKYEFCKNAINKT